MIRRGVLSLNFIEIVCLDQCLNKIKTESSLRAKISNTSLKIDSFETIFGLPFRLIRWFHHLNLSTWNLQPVPRLPTWSEEFLVKHSEVFLSFPASFNSNLKQFKPFDCSYNLILRLPRRLGSRFETRRVCKRIFNESDSSARIDKQRSLLILEYDRKIVCQHRITSRLLGTRKDRPKKLRRKLKIWYHLIRVHWSAWLLRWTSSSQRAAQSKRCDLVCPD